MHAIETQWQLRRCIFNYSMAISSDLTVTLTLSCSRPSTLAWLVVAVALKESFLSSSNTLLCSMYLKKSKCSYMYYGNLDPWNTLQNTRKIFTSSDQRTFGFFAGGLRSYHSGFLFLFLYRSPLSLIVRFPE